MNKSDHSENVIAKNFINLIYCKYYINNNYNLYLQELSFGNRTLGENLSDAMGIHAVFDAYKKLLSKTGGSDRKLPNFEEFTDEQMLFISYGNVSEYFYLNLVEIFIV